MVVFWGGSAKETWCSWGIEGGGSGVGATGRYYWCECAWLLRGWGVRGVVRGGELKEGCTSASFSQSSSSQELGTLLDAINLGTTAMMSYSQLQSWVETQVLAGKSKTNSHNESQSMEIQPLGI